MSAITINDLPTSRALDGKALSSIRGANNGLWTIGWIQPYLPQVPSSPYFPVVNFFQVTNTQVTNNVNNILVKEMNNLVQTVDINNSGATSTINAVLVGSLAKNA